MSALPSGFRIAGLAPLPVVRVAGDAETVQVLIGVAAHMPKRVDSPPVADR